MTIDKDSITTFNTTITSREGNMRLHVTCTSAIGMGKPCFVASKKANFTESQLLDHEGVLGAVLK